MRAPLQVKNKPTHDRLLLEISKQPCASLSVTFTPPSHAWSFAGFAEAFEHFEGRREEGDEAKR